MENPPPLCQLNQIALDIGIDEISRFGVGDRLIDTDSRALIENLCGEERGEMSFVTTPDDEDGSTFEGRCGVTVTRSDHRRALIDGIVFEERGSVVDVGNGSGVAVTADESKQDRCAYESDDKPAAQGGGTAKGAHLFLLFP